MGATAKPSAAAFRTALEAVAAAPGPHVTMFEDSLKNLATARGLGLTTLLVGTATAAEEGAAPASGGAGAGGAANPGEGLAPRPGAGGAPWLDGAVAALTEAELRRALPHLWDAPAPPQR